MYYLIIDAAPARAGRIRTGIDRGRNTAPMNFDIFRAYDIRGIYPEEIDEEAVRAIAKGYTAVFSPDEVAVGMDARLSSPALKKSLVESLLESGIDVVDIGRATTDMLYFAVGRYGYSGGIIVSASHNPREYNGLKMVREKVTAISSDTGLFEIRDLLKSGPPPETKKGRRGTLRRREIIDDYAEHVLSFVDTGAIRPFSFVANANYGYVGASLRRIAERLPLEITPLNFEPDGSFPKGRPDPLIEENRVETERLIGETGVDFGAAWDADGDRVFFFDETGRFISGAYTTALLAKIMLEKHGSDNKIILDPRITWPILRTVSEMGGRSIISKCGHTFIKDRMRSENALFAGEMSAHYYFRDNYYADNGIIPLVLLLEYMSKHRVRFSGMIDPFMANHVLSGEINFRVRSTDEVIERVRERFRDEGTEDFTDGYSVESDDWRFNIRPSNTEPLLRLNVEAREKRHIEEITRIVEGIAGA
jgi:phosphomannomutase